MFLQIFDTYSLSYPVLVFCCPVRANRVVEFNLGHL